ncbi:hypothetical protein C0J52_28270, partial [Blattella germanica]
MPNHQLKKIIFSLQLHYLGKQKFYSQLRHVFWCYYYKGFLPSINYLIFINVLES